MTTSVEVIEMRHEAQRSAGPKGPAIHRTTVRHAARRIWLPIIVCFVSLAGAAAAQRGRESGVPATSYLLRPARVFDGEASHEGWAVLVRGQRIEAAGAAAGVTAPPGAETISCSSTGRSDRIRRDSRIYGIIEQPSSVSKMS